MINSVENASIEHLTGPRILITHVFRRYVDRIVLAVAIVSIVLIAVIH
jgi:hypothetical protein